MAADLATLGIRLTNAQAVADAKATGAALEEMGVKGEAAAKKIAGSSSPVTTAIKQQAVDYNSLYARMQDFVRAGANASQVSQMMGTSLAQSAAAVKMYSGTVAKSEIDVMGLRAAQSQLALANLAVGESAVVGSIGFNMAGAEVGRLRQSLASAASMMTGLPPIIGRIASTVGVMFVGMWEIVAVLAAIAAASWVWNKMTEGVRALKKETDDAMESLRKLGETKWDVATGQMKLAVGRVEELHTKLEQLTGDLNTIIALQMAHPGILTSLLGSFKGGQASDTGAEITAAERALRTAKLNVQDVANEKAKAARNAVWADLNRSFQLEKDFAADRAQWAKEAEAAADKARAAREKDAAARDKEHAELRLQQAEAAEHWKQAVVVASKMKLVPESAVPQIPGMQNGAPAEAPYFIRHAEAVESLTKAYKDAKEPFKSVTAAVGDFKDGLKAGVVDMLQAFAPRNIGKGLMESAYNVVTNAIGDTFHKASEGIRHAIFGQSGEEKNATRQAADSAKAMALQLDAVTKALGGDQLGATIAALQIGLISTLQAINSALPGTKNEKARNDARALATSQEAQQEEVARKQYAHAAQYANEDLAVRNMRATGQGDAADKQAFINQQTREMQAAIDANKDATYLSYLATVQNNELTAFLNKTLSSALNVVEGYRLQATIFGAMNPGPPTPYNPTPPPPTGVNPPTTGPGYNSGGDLTVNVVADGRVIGRAVLKDFQSQAQAQFGESSQWSNIQ